MRTPINTLCDSGILAYANTTNYPNVKPGDIIELVEEDAALMEPIHRKQHGTTAVVDRMLGTDMIVKIVVPCTVYADVDLSLSDSYFNG